MPIKIEIAADTVAEINVMLDALRANGLSATPGLLKFNSPIPGHPDAPKPVSALVSVEPMDMGDEASDAVGAVDEDAEPTAEELPVAKKGRGRPRKEAPGAVPEIAPAPATAPEPDVFTPEKTREEAIKIFAMLFSKSSDAMAAVRTYQNELGVKKFVDVPLDQAGAMMAKAIELKAMYP